MADPRPAPAVPRLVLAIVLVAAVGSVVAAFAAGIVASHKTPRIADAVYGAMHAVGHPVLVLIKGNPKPAPTPPAPPLAEMAANTFRVIQGPEPVTGTVLVGLRGRVKGYPQRIVEVDRAGHVVWQFNTPETGSLHDIRKLPNGDVLYSVDDEPAYVLAAQGSGSGGTVVEVNRAGVEVRKVKAHVTHQADMLANGNLLLVDGQRDEVSEIDPQGALVWDWKASDHILPYTASTFVGWDPYANITNWFTDQLAANSVKGREDRYHTNSAQRLANGHTLISLRNADVVVEVDTAGNIVSSYGALILKHQHCGFVIDDGLPGAGHLLVTDNGNARVIEVDRATQEIVWSFDQGLLIPYQGCANRLPNGDTFITDAEHNRVLEVTPSKQVAWQMYIEIPATFGLYRAWWSPS